MAINSINLLIFLKQAIFLLRNMNYNKKIITESEIKNRLRQGEMSLPPLTMRFEPSGLSEFNNRLDGLMEVAWGKQQAEFGVEIKTLSTPKAFSEGISYLGGKNRLPPDVLPMLIVPYLKKEQLKELEAEGISGIDLCGNGVVIAENKFSIYRAGQPNLFPSPSSIKNVYRKNSSLVSRLFLVRPVFSSVNEVLENVADLDVLSKTLNQPSIKLSTVSKALAEMENDLIISRANGRIKLLQPEALLSKLSQNYIFPDKTAPLMLKVDLDKIALLYRLSEISKTSKVPFMVSGLSSVSRYAVMQRGEGITLYTSNPAAIMNELPCKETDKFANLTLIEERENTTFFDAQNDEGLPWASPVQTYLELINGDKRDQETAQQVKQRIVNDVKERLL